MIAVSSFSACGLGDEGGHILQIAIRLLFTSVVVCNSCCCFRREKERLAHKLDCGPSQNTEDFMAAMDLDGLPVSVKVFVLCGCECVCKHACMSVSVCVCVCTCGCV